MKSQSGKYVEGVVLGHAVKANKPKQMRTKRFTTVVIDAYLGGSLQIWAEGYVQLVGCETKHAVAIKNNGDIRVASAQRILDDLRITFPLGSKVMLEKSKYGGSNVTTNGPVFVLASNHGTLEPENTKEAAANPAAAPTGGEQDQQVIAEGEGQEGLPEGEQAPDVQ